MPEARRGQLDASLVLAWTRGVAARWLPPHAVYRRNDLPPQAVRQVALATIRGTAEAMAAAPGRTGGECSTNAERIAEWLTACANDVAQTDQETNPEQRMEEFATEPRKSAPAAERRWNGLLRENTQATGTGWVRGRDTGPASFSVSRIGGIWTVIEHGWPEDHPLFRTQIINAAAAATVRQAEEGGKNPAPVEEVAKRLTDAAASYCGDGEAQPPADNGSGPEA